MKHLKWCVILLHFFQVCPFIQQILTSPKRWTIKTKVEPKKSKEVVMSNTDKQFIWNINKNNYMLRNMNILLHVWKHKWMAQFICDICRFCGTSSPTTHKSKNISNMFCRQNNNFLADLFHKKEAQNLVYQYVFKWLPTECITTKTLGIKTSWRSCEDDDDTITLFLAFAISSTLKISFNLYLAVSFVNS